MFGSWLQLSRVHYATTASSDPGGRNCVETSELKAALLRVECCYCVEPPPECMPPERGASRVANICSQCGGSCTVEYSVGFLVLYFRLPRSDERGAGGGAVRGGFPAAYKSV